LREESLIKEKEKVANELHQKVLQSQKIARLKEEELVQEHELSIRTVTERHAQDWAERDSEVNAKPNPNPKPNPNLNPNPNPNPNPNCEVDAQRRETESIMENIIFELKREINDEKLKLMHEVRVRVRVRVRLKLMHEVSELSTVV